VIEVVKQSNLDGYITLRMYESQNKFTKSSFTSNFEIANVYEVNLLGEKLNKLKTYNNKTNITLTPFEIKTIYIELQ
jgi:alpha-mannosidase